jgi:hypothetical protein
LPCWQCFAIFHGVEPTYKFDNHANNGPPYEHERNSAKEADNAAHFVARAAARVEECQRAREPNHEREGRQDQDVADREQAAIKEEHHTQEEEEEPQAHHDNPDFRVVAEHFAQNGGFDAAVSRRGEAINALLYQKILYILSYSGHMM